MKLKKPIRLTTAQIFDCVNNSRNYNLRMNYLNNQTMTQIIVDQQEDGLCAMAVFSMRQYESCSYVKIGWNGLIETADCNCPYCVEIVKCAHVAALLSWLQENVNALDVPYVKNTERMEESMALWEEVFDSSFELILLANEAIGTKGKMNLQRSLDWTKLLIARKQNEQILMPVLARGSVHLQLKESENCFSYYRIDDCKTFELKIGKDRYYVVKSVPELLNRIQNEETYKYGKELEFCHTREVFDHNSRRLLEFLEWYSRFNSYYDPRHIVVSEHVLPVFFDCMADLDESDCTDVTVDTRTVAIPLRFEKQQQYGISYYSCEQELPEGTYVSGCWYQWENHTLIRYTADQPKEVLALTEALSMDLQIEESLMPAFMETYVLPCQKDLVVEGIDLNKYRRMENWTFYCDANENHELTILAVSEGAEKNYLFDPQYRIKSFKARQMEAFILQYAYGVDEESYQAIIRERHAMEFCTNQMETLKSFGDVYISDALKRMSIQRKLHMSVGVSLSGNLVNVSVNTDGIEAEELQQILRAYHKKKKYYRLKDGTFVNLEENEELRDLAKLDRQLYLSDQKMEDGQYVLNPSVAMRLANTDDSFEQIQVLRDESFNQLMNSLNHWDSTSLKVPVRYETVLRDYQKDGYQWIKQLEQLGFHGILADDMGLGKTLQCISVLDSARSGEHHSLIVCPSSLLFNWQQELQRFAPDMTSQIIMGNQMLRKELIRKIADYDVSITSYDYLKRDIEQYNSLSLYYVVLDEAQYIKNQKTQSALSVKQLQCEHRLAMTGTPIENNLAELWSIFDFLMPGFLFNYHYFQTNYERPIVRDEEKELSEELKKMVSPFILRRRKNDVLRELPEKTEVVVPITFESDEWKQYLANLAVVNKEVKQKLGIQTGKIEVLAMLTRLRQLCLDRRLVDDTVTVPSSKLNACMELVESLQDSGKKVLVFSAFTSFLSLVEEQLKQRNISYYLLKGDTDKTERQRMVSQFQMDHTTVFLISLKAGGTGLNLTKAEAVIHLDPWWNISAQNQATDRAHRIGQKNPVTVYKLVMKDSIEERIMELQEKKKGIADVFVENSSTGIGSMSEADWLELFEIPVR